MCVQAMRGPGASLGRTEGREHPCSSFLTGDMQFRTSKDRKGAAPGAGWKPARRRRRTAGAGRWPGTPSGSSRGCCAWSAARPSPGAAAAARQPAPPSNCSAQTRCSMPPCPLTPAHGDREILVIEIYRIQGLNFHTSSAPRSLWLDPDSNMHRNSDLASRCRGMYAAAKERSTL